jgi:hypothetical protein
MVSADWGHHQAEDARGPLTEQQYDAAVAVAQHEIDREKARITTATAVLRHRTLSRRQSNLPGLCTSGRVIEIRLTGKFPHITTSGIAGVPSASGHVTSVGITADALSGRACLLGVGTGRPAPYRHGADLLPALHR